MSSSARTTIRPVVATDRDHVVEVARSVVGTDTYAFEPNVTDDELWAYFAPSPPGNGYVAVDDGRVAGVFVIRPNHPGAGSHVANASFVVASSARGRGLGRTMGEQALDLARASGYRAMQFNIVVATNPAVDLWRSLGFDVVGTVPDGFRLADGSYADHHVMYRRL